MKERMFGRTGKSVSEIGLGTWQLGTRWGEPFQPAEAMKILETAAANGITFVDTADVYNGGKSEETIGEYLSMHPGRFYVTTKCGRRLNPHTAENYTAEAIAGFIGDSLRRMRLERLGMILLTIAVCLFSFKTVVYPTPYGKNRIAGLENISEILTENGLSYGYVTYRHYKVLEIVSAGQQRNAVISYDEDAGRYCVDYDRIYLEELKKPVGIDKFYILKHTEFDETLPEDVLLEETCTSKIDLGYETIYIFPMEDWEKVMAEK